jgi:uncharacterized damage-inducible protein DinB
MTESAPDQVIDAQGRLEPPVAGAEAATLLGFLEFQRATFEWKCRGLESAGLQARTAASALTLGGMMKHLALVEHWWFARSLHGQPYAPPWDAIDWDATPDWDMESAADDTPEELLRQWRDAVERSRELLNEAMSVGGLDHAAARGWSDGRTPNVRWIVVHMIEEYARHNGHADLIREAGDGQTGE